MKRKISFIMALLITLSSFGLTENTVYADDKKEEEVKVEKALIESIKLDKDQVNLKDHIQMEVKLDKEIEDGFFYLVYKSPIDGKDLVLQANKLASGKNTYGVSREISEMNDGKYSFKEIKTKEGSKLNLSLADKLTFPSFTVKSEVYPVVELAGSTLLKENLKVKDEFKMIIDLKEASDIEEILLAYEKPISKSTLFVTAKKTEDKKFIASFEVTNEMENGTYKFSSLQVKDSQDNRAIYSDLKLKDFTIKGTTGADTKPPVVSRIELDKNSYSAKQVIKMTLELEEEDSVDKIAVVYEDPLNKTNFAIDLEKVGAKVYSGTKLVAQSDSLGEYKYDFIVGKDKAGNELVLKKGLTVPEFKLVEKSDKTIELVELVTDKKVYVLGDTVNFKAKINNLEDDSNLNLQYRYGKAEKLGLIGLIKGKDGYYTGQLKINADHKLGDYEFYRITSQKDITSYPLILDVNHKVDGSFKVSKLVKANLYEEVKLDPKDYGGDSLLIEAKEKLKVKSVLDKTYLALEEGRVEVKVLEDKKIVNSIFVDIIKDEAIYKEEYANKETILFNIVRRHNPNLKENEEKIIKPGKNGYKAEVIKVKIKDGKEVARINMGSQVIEEATDQIVEIGSKEILTQYLSLGVNVRDRVGNKLGNLPYKTIVSGKEVGNKIEITYKDQKAYLDKKFVRELKLEDYVSKGVNVRNLKGEKIGYLSASEIIEGVDMGDHIQVIYKGEVASLAKKFLSKLEAKEYISLGVNVRNLDNAKVGYLAFGEKIEGKDLGSVIEIEYKGEKLRLSKAFLRLADERLYTSKGVNVRDAKGKKIGYVNSGLKLRGVDLGNKIMIDFNANKGFISNKFVK